MTETFLSIKDRPRPSLDATALADLAPAIAVYEQGILEMAHDLAPILAEAKAAGGWRSESTSKADLPVLMAAIQGINVQAGDFAQAPLKTGWPSFLAGDPRAFAILMPDASMMPRFDAGHILYVSPARNLEGENIDVVLDRVGGGFLIGRLAGMTAAAVRLSTLSPRARDSSYDRAKIRGVYRIVGVQRLGG